MLRIALIGGGGHARDIWDAVGTNPGIICAGYFADSPPARVADPSQIGNIKYLGSVDDYTRSDPDLQYLLAVGYPTVRRSLWDRVRDWHRSAAILVHSAAQLAKAVHLSSGAVVLGGAHISPGVAIAAHSHVSYLAAVGHDSRIGECTTIMPAAIVSGNVTLGHDVLVGTNATILEGLQIGDHARVGAGAVVTRNVPAGATVVGVPAQPRPASPNPPPN